MLSFNEFLKEAGKIKDMSVVARSLAKGRKEKNEAAKEITLTRLNNNGKPSGMHDAIKKFKTEEEAIKYVENIRKLNPGKSLRYLVGDKEI